MSSATEAQTDNVTSLNERGGKIGPSGTAKIYTL